MTAPAPHESEWLTRKKRIDPQFKALGWQIVPFDPARPLSALTHHAITEFETANGPADYAFCVAGELLGITEVKKLTLGEMNVLTQAVRYSKGVADSPFDFRGFRVPFLYATNGEVLWFHDIRHPLNRSRRLNVILTPAAFREMLSRDFSQACAWFGDNPNRHQMLRPYQVEANHAVETGIA
jgi:type I restriction enzyme R subunit